MPASGPALSDGLAPRISNPAPTMTSSTDMAIATAEATRGSFFTFFSLTQRVSGADVCRQESVALMTEVTRHESTRSLCRSPTTHWNARHQHA